MNSADTNANKDGAPAQPAPPAPISDANNELVRHASTVGFWTLISRVLGLVRFRLLAHYFGASFVADAFNFAFVFPNITRRLFGEGFASNVFVPIFSAQLAKGDKNAANQTATRVLIRLFYWLSLGCVGILALTAVARVAIPMDDATRLKLQLFQWLLPYMVFINLAAVFMGILNSLGHFSVPAFAPVLFNLAVIGVCNQWVLPMFGEKPDERIWIVAYAVLAGGLLQLLVMIPPALARGFKFNKGPAPEDEGYTEVMNGFRAMALLVAVFQINVMLDNIIAELLIPGDGPVTYLNMGTSVYQFVWAVISLAIGTVALPAMSKLWAQSKTLEFETTLRQALRLSFFFAIPATVGIALLSEEVVRLLYGSGKFLENDGEPIRRTAGVALYSSLGLVFFSLNAIYARALYAMKDMRTPTVTSAWSVAINVGLNLAFVLGTPLQESGIALASAISNGWQTWALAKAVRNKLNASPDGHSGAAAREEVAKYMKLLAGAVLGSGVAGFIAYKIFVSKKDWTGYLAILNEGFIAFFAAILASLILLSFIMRGYFDKKLKDAPLEKDIGSYRYGRKEEHWSDALRFQFSLYATIMSSAVMGFGPSGHARHVLPPEGGFIAVLQRALAPVVVGLIAYYFATSGMHSPDYQELLNVLRRKKKSTGAEQPKP